MTLPIRNPNHMPAALRSMTDTIALYPRMPESIKGWMLAVPCKRILRAVYGSAYRAILAWLVAEVMADLRGLRSRFYLTREERGL
jgi:hypothetical protein